MEAAELSAPGQDNAAVARQLRISVRSNDARTGHGRTAERHSPAVEWAGLQGQAERGTARSARAAAGQEAGNAWPAEPDLNAGAEQDPDQTPVPREHEPSAIAQMPQPARLRRTRPSPPRPATGPGPVPAPRRSLSRSGHTDLGFLSCGALDRRIARALDCGLEDGAGTALLDALEQVPHPLGVRAGPTARCRPSRRGARR